MMAFLLSLLYVLFFTKDSIYIIFLDDGVSFFLLQFNFKLNSHLQYYKLELKYHIIYIYIEIFSKSHIIYQKVMLYIKQRFNFSYMC